MFPDCVPECGQSDETEVLVCLGLVFSGGCNSGKWEGAENQGNEGLEGFGVLQLGEGMNQNRDLVELLGALELLDNSLQ